MAAEPSLVARAESGAPPRARILKTARELFYRDGIHAVSVDAIAEAAGSNKTTLYRHFESKDELVAECLRELTRDFDLAWADIQGKHAGEPKQQLLALLRLSAEFKVGPDQRGCDHGDDDALPIRVGGARHHGATAYDHADRHRDEHPAPGARISSSKTYFTSFPRRAGDWQMRVA